MADHQWGFRTRALHAGARPDPHTGARAVPIYQTTSFVFEDAQDAADLFALQKYGSIYTRIGNPTIAAFEERVASLEGGIGAVATSSGQAAEYLAITSLAGAGDNIVANSSLYGGTVTQFDVTLRRLGIDVRTTDDGWIIHPGTPTPGTVETYEDHRMAMSFALLGLRHPGIEIADPSCVAKTFPDFFDVLDALRTI